MSSNCRKRWLGLQGIDGRIMFEIENLLVHIVGEVRATRITVDTKISDIL